MNRFCLFGAALLLSAAAAGAMDFAGPGYRYQVAPSYPNGFYTSVLQRWVTAKNSDAATDKTRYTATAAALGYQRSTDQLTGGLSMSYEWGKSKNDWSGPSGQDASSHFRLRDRTLGFTLFGEYRAPAGGWYGRGSAFLGFVSQKVRDGGYRDYGNGERFSVRSGDPRHSEVYGMGLEVGKRMELMDGLRLTPHAGFDYAHTSGKSFTLEGVVAPGQVRRETYRSRSQNYYEIPLGVTLAKDWCVADWLLTPSVDLTLVSAFGGQDRRNTNFNTGFASSTGQGWKVHGVGADHWGGRITAGMKAVKAERFDIDLNYGYEGRKSYNDHRLTATFGVAF